MALHACTNAAVVACCDALVNSLQQLCESGNDDHGALECSSQGRSIMRHYRIASHTVRKRLFGFVALLTTFSNRNYSPINSSNYYQSAGIVIFYYHWPVSV